MSKILKMLDIDDNEELIGRKIKVLSSKTKKIGDIYTCHCVDFDSYMLLSKGNDIETNHVYSDEEWELLDE